MHGDSIYVETTIDADLDEIWRLTQDPDEHVRWDLRFTDITRRGGSGTDDDPQRFTYATRIGGVEVSGTGESAGTRSMDGETTSTLRFRSDDPKALIREGTGFWRYVGTDGGVRFLTEYNYEPRWGVVGRALDAVAFRPLVGWATAWSFDCLRRWVEDGVPPESSLRQTAVHALARVSLAFAFVYLGLVPKLLVSHPTELALVRAGPVPAELAWPVVAVLGVAEVVFGVALLAFWRRRWLFVPAAVGPVLLTLGAVAVAPETLLEPFNPVVLAVALVTLGVVGFLAGDGLPTAANCRRVRPDEEGRSRD